MLMQKPVDNNLCFIRHDQLASDHNTSARLSFRPFSNRECITGDDYELNSFLPTFHSSSATWVLLSSVLAYFFVLFLCCFRPNERCVVVKFPGRTHWISKLTDCRRRRLWLGADLQKTHEIQTFTSGCCWEAGSRAQARAWTTSISIIHFYIFTSKFSQVFLTRLPCPAMSFRPPFFVLTYFITFYEAIFVLPVLSANHHPGRVDFSLRDITFWSHLHDWPSHSLPDDHDDDDDDGNWINSVVVRTKNDMRV